MDERARQSVALPRAGPTKSFWQDPPDEIADLQSTADLPSAADVVVIGSGITGAAVAWGLLNEASPPASVVMLEARQACSGATGRNGGHTKAASYRSFMEHATELGAAAACQIARLELANIRAVHAFAAERGIACDADPCRTVDVVYDAAQWEAACVAVTAMQAAMPGDDAADYELYSPEEVADRFHCGRGGDEGVCGGVGYLAGRISAYQLVVGLLKLCIEKGLNLQTNTPAVGLQRREEGRRWEVQTPRGVIITERIVLATNGYTAALVKRFQDSIVPLRGQVTVHRAGGSMPTEGLATTYSFIYEGGYEYMVSRPRGSACQGDIVIGGGLARAEAGGLYEYGTTDDTTVDETISAYLRETTPRYFGDSWGEDAAEGRIRSEWTGVMGYTPDGRPFIGEMPGEPDLWVACAFQGHGMVYSWTCARALLEMMQGRDGPALRSWFPECFRLSEERMQKRFHGQLQTSARRAGSGAD